MAKSKQKNNNRIYLIVLVIVVVIIICCSFLLFLDIPWGGFSYDSYKWIDNIKNKNIKNGHKNGLPLDKEICHENLSLIHEVLSKNNIMFWLSEGTALGFIRDGDFISHDDDVDIALFSRDKEKFWKSMKEIKQKGFTVVEVSDNGTFICLIRKNEKIDIDITGEGLKCTSTNGKKCEIILPYLKSFNTINIRGKSYNLPKQDYLEFIYGPTWKIPLKEKNFYLKKINK